MSDALFATTQAFVNRIKAAATGFLVHVGAPSPDQLANIGIALILFDIRPSAALRNVPRFASPPTSGPVTGPAAPVEVIALDLRYLLVCFRTDSALGADPDELKALGRILAALHADPLLDATPAANDDPPPDPPPSAFAEQIVRVSLESYGLDEWNRLWALFPELSFRTSVVYLATPVYVTVAEAALYPRIQSRESRTGLIEQPEGEAA